MARLVLIFSIVIGLAAAFLGWKTKEQADKLQADLKTTKGNLATTQANLTKTKKELDDTKTELDTTKTTLQKTEMDLTNAKGELANAKTELAAAKAAEQEKATKLAELEAQIAKMKVDIGDIPPAQLAERIKQLTTDLEKAKTEAAEAQQVLANVQSKVAGLEGEVSQKERTIQEYKSGFVRNGLTGRVLAVNPGWNFVVLNIGDKAGLKVGAKMVVSRGGSVVGKVKVTSVEPNQSIGDILPGTLARGDTVQPGDSVIFEGGR